MKLFTLGADVRSAAASGISLQPWPQPSILLVTGARVSKINQCWVSPNVVQ